MLRSIICLVSVAVLVISSAACGSDGSGGGDGDGDADGSGDGDGSGSSGGNVTTCTQLCSFAPVNSSVGNCVTQSVTLKGYDVNIAECENANTDGGCNACYDAISITDAHCAAVHDECF